MSDSGEKTFEPTARRRQEAARKGDVLRSRELGTAAAVLVGAAWLKLAGPSLFSGLEDVVRMGFTWDRATLDGFAPGVLVVPIAKAVLPPIFGLAGVVILAALISQLSFSDGRFNASNLAPKPSRLNPLSGLKRMFGPTGWIEMAKGIAKVGLLGAIAYGWGRSQVDALGAIMQAGRHAQLALAWDAIISLLFALSAGLVVIALIDLPIQMLRRSGRLRMSHQEMRDEHKQSEGSPENKAAQRQRQRDIAMGGVQSAMREAQFVLTNPRRFAVAMAYDPDRASAPIVLAKGRGEKALAMRELAAEFGVPTLEFPALARSVYFTTRERQVIREELYSAIASVLAFVLSVRRGDRPERPVIHVPVELRFDAAGQPDPRSST